MPRRSLTVTIIIGPVAVAALVVLVVVLVLDCVVEDERGFDSVLGDAEGMCFAAAFAPNLDAIEEPNLDAVLRLSVSFAAGMGVDVVSADGMALSLLLVDESASFSRLLLRSVSRSTSFLLSRGRASRFSRPSRSRYLSRDSRFSDAGALLFHLRPLEMAGSRLLGRRGLRERSRLCDGAMIMCTTEECSSSQKRKSIIIIVGQIISPRRRMLARVGRTCYSWHYDSGIIFSFP